MPSLFTAFAQCKVFIMFSSYFLACSAGVLLERVSITTLWPLSVRQWGMGEGKSEIFFARPPPLSSLLPIVHPLGRTFFLSPVFHCLKNSRWQQNFLWFERSHKKIPPALQAIYLCVLCVYFDIILRRVYFLSWLANIKKRLKQSCIASITCRNEVFLSWSHKNLDQIEGNFSFPQEYLSYNQYNLALNVTECNCMHWVISSSGSCGCY